MRRDLNLVLHPAGYRPGTRHRAHQHDVLHFSMVLCGTVSETARGVTVHGRPLSVVAKDAGLVHANDFGREGSRLARLSVAAESLGELLDHATPWDGWRWTHDARVARPFIRLLRRLRGERAVVSTGDPDAIDLLAGFTARPASVARGVPPRWLRDVMCEMDEGWAPELRVATVAARAGVHPVYLARCVRRWYDISVGDVIRSLRLRAAALAVAAPGGTVSDVAHACGFADEAHFCRTFREASGLTPGSYRRLVNSLPYRWHGGS